MINKAQQERDVKQHAKEALAEVKKTFKILLKMESEIGGILGLAASNYVRQIALGIFAEEDYEDDIADELDWEHNRRRERDRNRDDNENHDYSDYSDDDETPGDHYRRLREEILVDLEDDILADEQASRIKMYKDYGEIYDPIFLHRTQKLAALKSRLQPHFEKYIALREHIQDVLKENEEAIKAYRDKWYIRVWEGLVGSIDSELSYINCRADAMEVAAKQASNKFASEFLAVEYLKGKLPKCEWPEASYIIGDRHYFRMIRG